MNKQQEVRKYPVRHFSISIYTGDPKYLNSVTVYKENDNRKSKKGVCGRDYLNVSRASMNRLSKFINYSFVNGNKHYQTFNNQIVCIFFWHKKEFKTQ